MTADNTIFNYVNIKKLLVMNVGYMNVIKKPQNEIDNGKS